MCANDIGTKCCSMSPILREGLGHAFDNNLASAADSILTRLPQIKKQYETTDEGSDGGDAEIKALGERLSCL